MMIAIIINRAIDCVSHFARRGGKDHAATISAISAFAVSKQLIVSFH
jgi:hypothetical protein